MIYTLKQIEDVPPHHRPGFVLVSGGFDPLHYGHVRFFRTAEQIARREHNPWDLSVVVAVAPDSYVLTKHPLLQTLEHRMEVIDAIRHVNIVVPQEEETAATAIRILRPHIFLKGDDWAKRGLPAVEREAAEAVGVRIEYVPVNPVSSSELLIDYFWRMADMMGRH